MSTFERAPHPIDTIAAFVAAYAFDAPLRDDHLIGRGAIISLENKLRELYGFDHVMLTSSGTAGLLATALALDLKGEKFVTSAYGYGATLSAWLALGNKPIFADIDRKTLNIDPREVAGMLDGNVRAILSTDLFGVPSDTEALREIADRHGVWYIADGCQAFGATSNGKAASHLADAVVVSFTSGKDLAIGEGGAVLTNDADLYRRLLWSVQHPYRQKRELGISLFNPFSFNARMHPVAALWGDAVFESSLQRIRRRQEIYSEAISLLNRRGLIEQWDLESAGLRSSHYRLTVAPRVPAYQVVAALLEAGFAARALEPPAMLFHRSDVLRGLIGPGRMKGLRFPMAEATAEDRIALEIGKIEGGAA